MAEQMGRSDSRSSASCGDSSGSSGAGGAGGAASGSSAPGSQGSFAEVTVIDSQFQHFSSYIEVIRVYKCRLCTFCSPLEHVIASHMSEVHFPRRCFLCKQCLFVFEDRAQLASHLDSAHGTKSIAVCFGDATLSSTGYPPSSPPPTLRMMMRTAEGEERIQQQMMEEVTGEEARNGRVTSSTGNLANLTNTSNSSPSQVDSMEHSGAESGVAQLEGDRASEPPSVIGNTRQEQEQSHSSSCHPSSSNQANSSPDIIDCEVVNLIPRSEQVPPSKQSPSVPASQAPSTDLRVTIGKAYCQSYIKTEPISPVRSSQPQQGQKPRPYLGRSRHDPRSYMRRWSLTENSLSDDSTISTPARMSRSFDAPGSGSALQNGIEEEKANSDRDSSTQKIQKVTPATTEGENRSGHTDRNSECNKSLEERNDKEDRGKPMEKSKSLDTGKEAESQNLLGVGKSYISGRSLDGRPPRLVRQNVVEESPRSSPQMRVVADDSSISQEQNETSVVTIPCGIAEAMRRESFSRSFPGSMGRPPVEHLSNPKTSEVCSDFRPTLRDLVSSRMQRGERQQLPPSTAGAGQDQGIPPSSTMVPMMRSGRVRSYSVSEGDMQGLQKNGNPNRSLPKLGDGHTEASPLERDHPSGIHSRQPPGSPQVPAMIPHQYPALVYQPYSIEGEPKHMRYFNQAPRMVNPGPLDGPPHPLQMRQEDSSQQPGPNQPVEESFLYRYLRNNGGRKFRRNSISVSTLTCDVQPAGLVPSHGAPSRGMIPHPEGTEMMSFERQRGLAWPARHHPDHPFQPQGPFPSHMPPYNMAWKDKFDASQISPNTPVSAEQRHSVEYSGPVDRDPSARGEMVSGPNGMAMIDGKVLRAKQGEGGESNQDLAKDITRQVQQAMGITQGLYTPGDRHLSPWVEGNERSDSPDEPMDGDSPGQRRSRKSTFNIYREIPERKRKLDQEEEEKIKHSYNADGSFDYYSLTGWKAYKCDLCKKRRFKTASELQEHKQRKHGLQKNHSSQGSLNGLPEAAAALTVVESSELNESPSSG
ncbi:uncharacterized protein LOC110987855 [Acanthaster planci]|uniref:Uncharacterized protein LOC110987855 n=1 Tax=Acanthaster planci TaxID=133434 RepID=A0A8B7ZMJ8_ACAPL|nr:uncharacterized protein LOC110987855 [Acanthaster planci]XP_022106659.1 uncharacterized protein LOC110987855 [Acanthaster planci]XP_022106660.1 uncharacterized protein LOC110987855 [Acanthaster planci]XP_022106661.1 uncharacterized protein LOC110987855 [Acanthaster planci]XP_022106662.1 uncharacterized protein LOC110987855 [Acanthaster planci]